VLILVVGVIKMSFICYCHLRKLYLFSGVCSWWWNGTFGVGCCNRWHKAGKCYESKLSPHQVLYKWPK